MENGGGAGQCAFHGDQNHQRFRAGQRGFLSMPAELHTPSEPSDWSFVISKHKCG